ncbi:MAG: hypothetical protein ABTQ29_12760 [Siculibacillus sp.]
MPLFAKVDVLWSRGAYAHCDRSGPFYNRFLGTEHVLEPEAFARHYGGASGLVWVRLNTVARDGRPCGVDRFVADALPTIREPFVLITTDGDATVPSDIPAATVEALLNSEHLVAWYTQNHDGTAHPKLFPFPIGLDLHSIRGAPFTPAQRVAYLSRVRDRRVEADRLPLRVFTDLSVNANSGERRAIRETLYGVEHVDFLAERLSIRGIWRKYASYPFVLSTHGYGLDCHRTWEVLYLGGIVVTKRSSLDPLYRDLPVVIVDDWSEVASLDNLARWRDRYAPLTRREHVWDRLSSSRLYREMRAKLPPR